MENEIHIDTLVPGSTAHLIETREQVMLQHGGVVSRIHYDKVVVMDLQTFIKSEVPKLNRKAKELIVMRDAEDGNISLIYGDQVIKYSLTNIEDVPVDSIAKILRKHDAFEFYPEQSYPLVGYVDTITEKHITVFIDSHKVLYRSVRLGAAFEDTIYLPPIWFRVTLNKANIVIGAGIVIVVQKEPRAKDTPLCRWVLPNVHYPSANVCFGHTQMDKTSIKPEDMTEGVCVQLAYTQVFDSTWNTDLLSGIDYEAVVGNAYRTLPVIEDYEKRIKAHADQRINLCA